MKVVMIDQDGVVFNQDYRTTKDISGIIREITSHGAILVPNSDTPAVRLINNFERSLGLLPETVISEREAVISHKGKILTPANIQGIKEYSALLEKTFKQKGYLTAIGNSVTWIRQKKRFKPNQKILIIDGLRQQTVGFYLRVTDREGIAKVDTEWYSKGLKLVSTIPIPEGLIDDDYNTEYGIVIMHAKEVDKTTSYHFLKEIHPSAQFFMVGDSESDIIKDKSVVHCAVANGTKQLKSICGFVANNPFTLGLEECLKWICKY